MHHDASMEDNLSESVLPCGSVGLNSGPQALQQTPFPTQPFPWPFALTPMFLLNNGLVGTYGGQIIRAGEMAQLAAKCDLSSIPWTYVVEGES